MHVPSATPGRKLVTGAEYERQITAHESDRLARSAFRAVVLRLTWPGAKLFDFGCGTGMDARFYAERDRTVTAYDVDPQMLEFFRVQCEPQMKAGRVTIEEGNYHEFLARVQLPPQGPIDLITSNFAPLNLVADLHALFAKFHRLSAPNGCVLASVLCPYFIGDARYRWWWRHLPSLIRSGHYAVAGAQASILRRRLSDYAVQSAPYFTLRKIYRGLVSSPDLSLAPVSLHYDGTAWLHLVSCRYMFLEFGRR